MEIKKYYSAKGNLDDYENMSHSEISEIVDRRAKEKMGVKHFELRDDDWVRAYNRAIDLVLAQDPELEIRYNKPDLFESA